MEITKKFASRILKIYPIGLFMLRKNFAHQTVLRVVLLKLGFLRKGVEFIGFYEIFMAFTFPFIKALMKRSFQ